MSFLFILWSILFMDPIFSLDKIKWIVSEDSRLEIEGSTNVNKYNCALIDYSGTDILIQNDEVGVGNMSWAGDIVMKANNFDCFNPIMTRDFLKTVQAEEYPEIRIRFLELVGSRNPSQKEAFYGKVDITIAGVTKRFPVSCQLVTLSENSKKIVGSQSFKFTDFGIDPPVKFLGTVKVKDEIKVNFELFLVGKK
ncbi:YceI family protein [Anditalea andensis]|uniref:Lipid/polyisoprenoid-binding YceI-like domain-containing protein n=1 Tax=Anditalea andensis TaxID=1048983 RepID=A0A074L0R3_9BACT|nr:YceI family protein [Anditalea andensis]KEO75826.1 hypothetical protein EL17_22660 [Anditalea andensis]